MFPGFKHGRYSYEYRISKECPKCPPLIPFEISFLYLMTIKVSDGYRAALDAVIEDTLDDLLDILHWSWVDRTAHVYLYDTPEVRNLLKQLNLEAPFIEDVSVFRVKKTAVSEPPAHMRQTKFRHNSKDDRIGVDVTDSLLLVMRKGGPSKRAQIYRLRRLQYGQDFDFAPLFGPCPECGGKEVIPGSVKNERICTTCGHIEILEKYEQKLITDFINFT